MNAFLEQYGKAIIIIIIAAILIFAADGLSTQIKTNLNTSFNRDTDPAPSVHQKPELEENTEDKQTNKAIAVFSANDNSLTFYKVETIPEVGSTFNGKIVTKVYTDVETTQYYFENSTDYIIPGWQEDDNYKIIEKVEFKDTIKPVSTCFWFSDCYSLTSIILPEQLDTSQTTDMEWMFAYCSNLKSIEFSSSFDTSSVVNMYGMFYGSSNLISINFAVPFNTSNVIDMAWMFENCSKLSLDCSSWNIDNVTNYENFNKNATNVVAPIW